MMDGGDDGCRGGSDDDGGRNSGGEGSSDGGATDEADNGDTTTGELCRRREGVARILGQRCLQLRVGG